MSAKAILRQSGFTLLEVLVVAAVIGLLVAILVPAVQTAREHARRCQCSNNHRQVALAALQYAAAHDRLPALANPSFLGHTSGERHMSWRYTVLPYLEEQALYDTLSPQRKWWYSWDPPRNEPTKPVIVATFQCPSSVDGYPHFLPQAQIHTPDGLLFDALGREDLLTKGRVEGLPGRNAIPERETAWYGYARLIDPRVRPDMLKDVDYRAAKLAYIADGLSDTILISEEVVPLSVGGLYADHLWLLRTHEPFVGSVVPIINILRYGCPTSFHPDGVLTSFCDGSIHFLSDDTEGYVVSALLGRQDAVSVTAVP